MSTGLDGFFAALKNSGTSHPISWEEVIDRANKGLFGDLEFKRLDGSICRGPIKRIYSLGTDIQFDIIWGAVRDTPRSDWVNNQATGIRVSSEILPHFKDGTIWFHVPHLGEMTLYSTTRKDSTLDPAEVHGLKPDEIRQSRAREYKMPLDASWARIVASMQDWASDGGVTAEDQIRLQDEAAQFGP